MAKKKSDNVLVRYERFLKYLSEGQYTQEEICNFLNISKRTLYRYIQTARKQGKNITIKNGRIALAEPCKQKEIKIELSADEKLLLSLMIEATNAYVSFFFENNPEYFRTLFNLVPERFIEVIPQPKSQLTILQRSWLLRIYYNLVEKNEFLEYEITYQKPSGEINTYKIVPFRLLFQKRSWYIVAACFEENEKLATEYRTFRINRVITLHETGRTFLPEQIAEARKRYALDRRNAWEFKGGPGTTEVIIKVHDERYWTFLTEVCWHPTQRNHPSQKTISFEVFDPNEMLPFLVQFADGIEVIAPRTLREKLFEFLRKSIERNGC
ncbi:helix-turn-helix transcriptional regulator [Caldicellulosiruptor acetigenus]|uniref:Helix-turn-helix type 11 domain protein n=1 Tax=Caldicellulosiruptor acetigenus 6A TaxID=632516 RepID=G2PT73_9FIRM|nr:WYL domain-containing transcriptional regulator [Caldicellulosiruptor acetigenus]AEM74232.1 hypothetical protein Calla_1630 [Caldicellulosiruptor acetigenus 6A]